MTDGSHRPDDSNLSDDQDMLFSAALDDLLRAWGEGNEPTGDELLARHPALAGRIDALIGLAHEIAVVRPPMRPAVPGYELLEEAGRGGMGVVYRARQVGLGRIVALKVAWLGGGIDSLRERFLVEARALGQVRHANVVTIYEIIDLSNACAYAMEWIGGGTLGDLIERRKRAGAGLRTPLQFLQPGGDATNVDAVKWSCELGIALGKALAALHGHGLLHRDVKPGNVLLRSDGTPLLSDFGLVHDEAMALTRSGQAVGTPSYSPPEQLRGDRARLGQAADVYGLGATLHCLLSGAPPFAGRTQDELLGNIEARRRVPLTRLGFSLDLETVVAKCLEADPRDRYQSVGDVAAELQSVLDLRPIRARPLGMAARSVRLLRRNRRVFAAATTTAAMVLFASGLLVWWLYDRLTLPGRWQAAVLEARLLLLDPAHTELVILADRSPESPGASFEYRPSAVSAKSDELRAAYAKALALDPGNELVGVESQVVAVAVALVRGRQLPPAPLLARFAPATWAAAQAWAHQPDSVPSAATLVADRRAMGLLAYLTGRAAVCHEAWRGLDLSGDPVVDSATAQLHVTRGDFTRAWPRFARASAAWPMAGFLSIGMARCALAAGDLDQAEHSLAEAENQSFRDPFDTLRGVRGDLLVRQGRLEEARAEYDWMLLHHKALEVRMSYARLLESLGELHLACDLLLSPAEHEPKAVRGSFLARAVALWCSNWRSLADDARVELVLQEWAQGPRSLAFRLAALLPSADEAERDSILQQLTAAVARERAGDESPGEDGLRAIQAIAEPVRWVERLPRSQRGMHARLAVTMASEAMRTAGDGMPWLPPVARAIRRLAFHAHEVGWRILASVDSAVVEWGSLPAGELRPPGRSNFACGVNAAGDQMLLFGGAASGGTLGDCWQFDGERWRACLLPAETAPRRNAAIVHDGRGWVVLGGFGSWPDLQPARMWQLEPRGAAWQVRAGDDLNETLPQARAYHCMVHDRARDVIVLFGGCDKDYQPLNDTWEWSPRTRVWRCRQPASVASGQPGQSIHASMVYDPLRRRTWLIGGVTKQPRGMTWDAGMWSYDGERWTRIAASVLRPNDRAQAGFVFDPSTGRCLLHGGHSPTGRVLGDTWEWDGARWRLLRTRTVERGLLTKRSAAGVACMADGTMVVVGGSDGSGVLPESVLLGRVVDR